MAESSLVSLLYLEGTEAFNLWRKQHPEQWVDLEGACLAKMNLEGVNFQGAFLRKANLSGANLRGANLFGADLTNAVPRSADLTGATLSFAQLKGANLWNAKGIPDDIRATYIKALDTSLALSVP